MASPKGAKGTHGRWTAAWPGLGEQPSLKTNLEVRGVDVAPRDSLELEAARLGWEEGLGPETASRPEAEARD